MKFELSACKRMPFTELPCSFPDFLAFTEIGFFHFFAYIGILLVSNVQIKHVKFGFSMKNWKKMSQNCFLTLGTPPLPPLKFEYIWMLMSCIYTNFGPLCVLLYVHVSLHYSHPFRVVWTKNVPHDKNDFYFLWGPIYNMFMLPVEHVHTLSWVCAHLHLSMCMLPVEHVHASRCTCACFQVST